MATEYREVAIMLRDRKRIVRLWKRAGCRCLHKPWAEPWVDGGVWISYHLISSCQAGQVFTHDHE